MLQTQYIVTLRGLVWGTGESLIPAQGKNVCEQTLDTHKVLVTHHNSTRVTHTPSTPPL